MAKVNKYAVRNTSELLDNADWDEGGGYFDESVQKALEKQAEISFKAGMDAGRREVSEYINEHHNSDISCDTFLINWDEWQSKLKEWGLMSKAIGI